MTKHKLTKESFHHEIEINAPRYLMMLVANFLYSLSLVLFITPNKIVGGGVIGIATLFNLEFGISIGLVNILLNIPILLWALKTEGIRFILDCFVTVATLSLITDVMQKIPFLNEEKITEDVLLASMYAGILQGVAVGIYVKYRMSSGGTEALGRVMHHKFPNLSIPNLIAILNGIIVLTGAIVEKTPENFLYVLIIIFISSKLSDLIIVGLGTSRLCYIITDYPNEVSEVIMHAIKRGVTLLDSTGMYTNNKHAMLMVCIRKNQIEQVKGVLKKIDSNAFLIVTNVNEVYGKGFMNINAQRD